MTSLLNYLINNNLSVNEVNNSCGKPVFKVSDIDFLKRFLFLGAENGTHYIQKSNLVEQHIEYIEKMIYDINKHDILLETIREYINKAFKKDYILFVLARCCIEKQFENLRIEAYSMALEICKIPTHLFLFIEFYILLNTRYYKSTGWNKLQKQFVSKWYLSKEPKNLLYLVTKYKNRNNWTHKDILKLTHIKNPDTTYDYIFKYITTDLDGFNNKKELANNIPKDLNDIEEYIRDYETIKSYNQYDENIINLIKKQSFVREHLSTNVLNNVDIWNALSANMPFTALLKNINKITQIGLFEKYPDILNTLVSKLNSKEAISKSNVHPLQILISIKMYYKGSGIKGKLSWIPNKQICTALNNAFTLSFDNIKSTNKRYSIALDVSGSMTYTQTCGIECLTPREISVAFAMILRKIEINCEINGFSREYIPLDISPLKPFETNIQVVSNLRFSTTDCCLPMMNAIQNEKNIDVFIILTDNETNANSFKPVDALIKYRKHSGIKNAKLIVVAMAANQFSLADPRDPNMLDICGFSPETFDAIQEFVML